MFLHFLDLIGVFAFAYAGAGAAKIHGSNSAGILARAFLTALGGGTIRTVMLHQSPAYCSDPTYILAVIIGIGAALLTRRQHIVMRPFMVCMDAIGVITFAYIGATVTLAAGLGPIAGIAAALLTSYGGGMLCDLLTGIKPPFSARPAVYVFPVVLTGAACWLASSAPISQGTLYGCVAVAFLIQIATTYAHPHTVRSRVSNRMRRYGKAHFLQFRRQALLVLQQIEP